MTSSISSTINRTRSADNEYDLLTNKLLMYGVMRARMESSIRKASGRRHELVDRSAGFVSQFVKKSLKMANG